MVADRCESPDPMNSITIGPLQLGRNQLQFPVKNPMVVQDGIVTISRISDAERVNQPEWPKGCASRAGKG